MISYEEAVKIALAADKNVNSCIEYRKAYRFFDKDSDSDGDCGVVIMKEDGRIKHFLQFLTEDKPEKVGRIYHMNITKTQI